jgi:hypothetical protein
MLFVSLLVVPLISAYADSSPGPSQLTVKIIMKDSSIVKGIFVGSDGNNIYVEKSGKVVTLKISSVVKYLTLQQAKR